MNRIKHIYNSIRSRIPTRRIGRFIDRKPFTSFFIALAILLVLIIVSNLISKANTAAPKKQTQVESVQVFQSGVSPKITVQAKVETSGLAKIVAQTNGIVQAINVQEGNSISQGSTIISLSTNYAGGNAPDIQKQLAQTTYQNAVDTYDLQKSIISSQRDVATASAENTEQLRQISAQSLNDTQSLLDQTQNQLTAVNDQITNLQAGNTNGANNTQIQQLQAQQLQLQSQVNQLQNTQRTLSYQTNTVNPPTTLANVQKDLTMKQLDLQEKTLDVTKQTDKLQVDLATVNEGLMFPASPFSGTVQRINVHVGDSVTPGTLLATIAGNSQSSKAVVSIPQQFIPLISQIDDSVLHIGNTAVIQKPTFISSDPTDGTLYTIEYAIPDTDQSAVADGEDVTIDIPLTQPGSTSGQTFSSDPFIPLDAIFQSQDSAYVYVVENKHAKSKTITLGNVYGKFVQVTSGIGTNDKVILNRDIIDGEAVNAQ